MNRLENNKKFYFLEKQARELEIKGKHNWNGEEVQEYISIQREIKDIRNYERLSKKKAYEIHNR
ncbi:hypothetical protein ABGF49_07410 [Helcococcus ovis]|uniref:hypothetical protein n=1 Tax=Helcococcus TaxID=31983 RepID=UPI0038BAB10E